MKSCSVLVIGGGRMGREHIRACVRLGEAVGTIAVVDPDAQARHILQQLGVRVFDSLKSADRYRPDVIIVASPTSTHLDIVQAVADVGSICLVEKPCSLNAEGFNILIDVARRAKATFRVGFWRRFAPSFRVLRDAMLSGSIGEPRLVVACQWDAEPPGLATQSVHTTGGIGLDCGIHETDTISWLGCGATNELDIRLPEKHVEFVAPGDADHLVASGRTSEGVSLAICLSRTAGADEIYYKVIGTAGSLELRVGDEATFDRKLIGFPPTREVIPGGGMKDALVRQMAEMIAGGNSIDCAHFEDARDAALPWLGSGK